MCRNILKNKCPSPPTLRSLMLTSGLTPTSNKRVCGSLRSPKPLQASHNLKLSEIPEASEKNLENYGKLGGKNG